VATYFGWILQEQFQNKVIELVLNLNGEVLNLNGEFVYWCSSTLDTFSVDANAESEKGGKRRKKMKLVETHSKTDRERTKYFADDDNFDLKTMFEREKLSTAEDQNAMLSRSQLFSLIRIHV